MQSKKEVNLFMYDGVIVQFNWVIKIPHTLSFFPNSKKEKVIAAKHTLNNSTEVFYVPHVPQSSKMPKKGDLCLIKPPDDNTYSRIFYNGRQVYHVDVIKKINTTIFPNSKIGKIKIITNTYIPKKYLKIIGENVILQRNPNLDNKTTMFFIWIRNFEQRKRIFEGLKKHLCPEIIGEEAKIKEGVIEFSTSPDIKIIEIINNL